jgi:AcrR family transcriptional regulator
MSMASSGSQLSGVPAARTPLAASGDDTRPEHGDSRAAILAAAATLFRERGYEGTSLKLIAQAAGMTAPALYWYFESKADLLVTFLLETADGSYRRIGDRIGDAQEPIEQLALMVAGHIESNLDLIDATRAYGELTFSWEQLVKSVGEERTAELTAHQRLHYDRCRDILDAGVRSGVFDVVGLASTAFAILGMCEQLAGWYRQDGPTPRSEIVMQHVVLALRMVGIDEATAIRVAGAVATA